MLYFTQERVEQTCLQLKRLVDCSSISLDSLEYVPSGYKTDNTPPADGWRPYQAAPDFGAKDGHFWFRTSFRTPQTDQGQSVYLKIVTDEGTGWDATNPQCIVYLNGVLTQGLDLNHTEVLLEPAHSYDAVIYYYCGMIEHTSALRASLVIRNRRVEQLYYDLKMPLEASRCLPKDSGEYAAIVSALDAAVNRIDLREPYSEAFFDGVEAAIKYMEEEFYGRICGRSGATANCIGHTHIDVAWLWTLAQTREKAQRSFATVVQLMKQYPEYRFMSSQPVLYKYVKEEAPALYEEIKRLVRQGRWEVEGAMWLEADCNLISGESLVRQILYGKRFMKEEFGVDSHVLWLPDVFGYSAALPQILKKSGVDRFVTSKISWNEMNKFPYDNFYWQGIDGSEVFTTFLTARDLPRPDEDDTITTYNAMITPMQIAGTWKRYQQKEWNDQVLVTFGWGDGGGGPTVKMLEQQRRLAYGLPGIPKTRILSVTEHLEIAERNFKAAAAKMGRRPKWVGELYLELHRGTYTSIAKNKRNNRKSELLYQAAETLCVMDKMLCGAVYPKQAFQQAWETILLNQFHDIIPGSSIFEVYEESDRQYRAVLEQGERYRSDALAHLAQSVRSQGGVLVYNPLSFARGGVIEREGKQFAVDAVPAFGWRVLRPETPEASVRVSDKLLENRWFRVQLDDSGAILSLFDKRAEREIVKTGARLNELRVFEDYPKDYDAWEISSYYRQKMWTLDEPAKLTPVFEGARAGMRIEKKYQDSVIVQTVYLYDNIERIDFETEIDWHQQHQLLKAAFPLELHAVKATYDIQFGHVERPTHQNTSWDAARFEVCAHKWADLSDNGYGVSLLNDCKYGHSADGSTLELTLLKCATHPNLYADQGKHRFTYALFPHEGGLEPAATAREAYALNQPLLAAEVGAQDGRLPQTGSFLSCDAAHVFVETVKLAEDSEDVIVRLYEAGDQRADVTLSAGFDFKAVVLCDLMENELEPLKAEGRSVTFPVANFEIVTLKFKV